MILDNEVDKIFLSNNNHNAEISRVSHTHSDTCGYAIRYLPEICDSWLTYTEWIIYLLILDLTVFSLQALLFLTCIHFFFAVYFMNIFSTMQSFWQNVSYCSNWFPEYHNLLSFNKQARVLFKNSVEGWHAPVFRRTFLCVSWAWLNLVYSFCWQC